MLRSRFHAIVDENQQPCQWRSTVARIIRDVCPTCGSVRFKHNMDSTTVGRACTSVNCTLAIRGASFHWRPNEQIPQSTRHNPLPMECINGALWMCHEHLAGALVEQRQ